MIIEGNTFVDISIESGDGELRLRQEVDVIMVDMKHATQLIEVLTKWVNGEEVE